MTEPVPIPVECGVCGSRALTDEVPVDGQGEFRTRCDTDRGGCGRVWTRDLGWHRPETYLR